MKKISRYGFWLVAGLGILSWSLPSCSSSKNAKPITHQTIDLDSVRWLTKFNSCCHVAVPSDNPIKVSRKHYLKPTVAMAGTTGQIKVYGPCDGTIVDVKDQLSGCSNGAVRGADVYVRCNANEDIQVVLYHVDLVSGLANGSAVKSGDLIAHANVYCADNPANESDFDIGVTNNQVLSPPLQYMDDTAIAPWVAKGVTADNSVLPEVSCSDADFAGTTCDSQKITF